MEKLQPDIKKPEDVLRDLSIPRSRQAAAVIREEEDKLDRDKEEVLRAKSLENDRVQAIIDKMRDDNRGRRSLSDALLTVTIVWMLLILLIVYQSGAGKLKFSDTVLVTLLTSTTVNVFAFLIIVVNYLFNKDKST